MDIETRFIRFIRDNISDIIKSEYKKYGFDVKSTDVEVRFQKQIIICINMENPNLGKKKFEFRENVLKRTKEAVKIFGYKYESSEDFYGFWILKYNFFQ